MDIPSGLFFSNSIVARDVRSRSAAIALFKSVDHVYQSEQRKEKKKKKNVRNCSLSRRFALANESVSFKRLLNYKGSLEVFLQNILIFCLFVCFAPS